MRVVYGPHATQTPARSTGRGSGTRLSCFVASASGFHIITDYSILKNFRTIYNYPVQGRPKLQLTQKDSGRPKLQLTQRDRKRTIRNCCKDRTGAGVFDIFFVKVIRIHNFCCMFIYMYMICEGNVPAVNYWYR